MNGREFRERRERLSLTQSALADRLKVSTSTVRNWEAEETAIPTAVEMVWSVWERRFQQESPHYGTVTLFYTNAPMFVDPQGPRPIMNPPGQELYLTNAGALARTGALWGKDGFTSPLILHEAGEILWTTTELQRVFEGDPPPNHGAPTIPVMMQAMANYLRAYSDRYVRTGPRMHTPAEIEIRQAEIKIEADRLDLLARADDRCAVESATYESIITRLHLLGMTAPSHLVNGVYHAYEARKRSWP